MMVLSALKHTQVLYLSAIYRAQVAQDTGEPYPPAKPHQEVCKNEV
jgi:hypothetical protein